MLDASPLDTLRFHNLWTLWFFTWAGGWQTAFHSVRIVLSVCIQPTHCSGLHPTRLRHLEWAPTSVRSRISSGLLAMASILKVRPPTQERWDPPSTGDLRSTAARHFVTTRLQGSTGHHRGVVYRQCLGFNDGHLAADDAPWFFRSSPVLHPLGCSGSEVEPPHKILFVTRCVLKLGHKRKHTNNNELWSSLSMAFYKELFSLQSCTPKQNAPANYT